MIERCSGNIFFQTPAGSSNAGTFGLDPPQPLPHFCLSSPPQCNNSEIRPGKPIGVCISVANNRLFVGSIPKSKTKEQIVEEFAKVTGESARWCWDDYFPVHLFCNCAVKVQSNGTFFGVHMMTSY